MAERISQKSVYQLCPRLATHLLALGKVEDSAGLEETVIHLVRIRVSQINHCCFCQHMHAEEARVGGERQVRLDVLPAWRDAPCFTTQERAALDWAEALTLINTALITDAVYQTAVEAFGEKGLIELTTVILEINSWNRVAVSLQFFPEID